MTISDNLSKLGTTVSRYAPVLGGVIAGPGGALIGSLVSNLFGGGDTDEIINKITTDPEAQSKLIMLQEQNKSELEKLKINQQISQINADLENTKSAREMNVKNYKYVDEIIKLVVISAIVIILFYGMYLIQSMDISEKEADIVKIILGADLASLSTVIGFYFGAALQRQPIRG